MLFFKLKENEEIAPERLSYIRSQVVLAQANQRALDYLSHRPRTRHEVEEKLAADYSADIIGRVMDMLANYGYVDDAQYAQDYANERSQAGYCTRKISRELKERGIPQNLAEAALERVRPNEVKFAATALKLRWRNGVPDDPKEKQRAYGYLARRGFGPEVIKTVTSTARTQ
jgi:regulatory protein